MKNKNIAKILFFTLLLIITVSCGDEKSKKEDQLKVHPLLAVLDDVTVLKDQTVAGKNPIVSFNAFGKAQADKTITITKSNIKTALEEAKNYSHAIITVKDHTIVKIKDLNNCKNSGVWATCIPFAEGYIKKGSLNYKEDYANNIIGRPDAQERLLFLFK